jgi:hypothetical protein
MRTIVEPGDILPRRLRGPDAGEAATDELLGTTAYTRGQPANMAGFQRIVIVGYSFEQTIQSGRQEVRNLADRLIEAVKASIVQRRDT